MPWSIGQGEALRDRIARVCGSRELSRDDRRNSRHIGTLTRKNLPEWERREALLPSPASVSDAVPVVRKGHNMDKGERGLLR